MYLLLVLEYNSRPLEESLLRHTWAYVTLTSTRIRASHAVDMWG